MNRAPTQGSPCGERRTRCHRVPTQGRGTKSKGAPWGNRMVGEGAHDRSILSGLRFPFERMTRFRWRVAAPGGWWQLRVAGGGIG